MFVLFATPCLSHRVHLDYMGSLIASANLLTSRGIGHALTVISGIPFIEHARNILCYRFLENFPHATDLFFLDDDIGWPADAVLRLLEHDVDAVAGAYPLKQDAGGFPVELLAHAGKKEIIQRNGLLSAVFLATGFTRFRRHVIERMAEDQPTYPYREADGTVLPVTNIFHTGYDPATGERLGEDVDFSKRWTAKGGELWIDPDITLSHIGRKRWTGNFAEALRETEYGVGLGQQTA